MGHTLLKTLYVWHRFVLRTDHSTLQWLHSFKETEGQIANWLEQLTEYNLSSRRNYKGTIYKDVAETLQQAQLLLHSTSVLIIQPHIHNIFAN